MMENGNGSRIFLRMVMAVVLIAILVGAGFAVYNMGVARGLASSGTLVAPNGAAPNGVGPNGVGPNGVYPYGYYGPFFRPWGFGFFPFGFIFPLLFFFLIFFLIRGLFFRGGRGWGRPYYGGPGGYDPNTVPPAVAEWHRKMHEAESSQSGDRTGQ